MHESESRTYTISDRVPPPYAHCFPELPESYPLNEAAFASQIALIYKSSDKYNRFDLIGENDRIRIHIEKALNNKIPFVIPRIAGVENNLAHVMHTKENIEGAALQKMLYEMKRNAGILFTNETSLIEYSRQYIDVFNKAKSYLGWEKWGIVYPYIAKSHDFITDIICEKDKEPFWAYALDIFNTIKYTPWTHALKGKKILIISAFIESIQSKISVREKIYGIDLFPECTFCFIKPPQTQGENPSRDWMEELQDFNKELDTIGDYDIALVSAGGYGNLICGEIFKRGRSAIYIGGVLQMYFGILGTRWERERPEIVKLYLNEYWSRPMDSEKPTGHNAIEGSCYW
jgi:hypothetical protein